MVNRSGQHFEQFREGLDWASASSVPTIRDHDGQVQMPLTDLLNMGIVDAEFGDALRRECGGGPALAPHVPFVRTIHHYRAPSTHEPVALVTTPHGVLGWRSTGSDAVTLIERPFLFTTGDTGPATTASPEKYPLITLGEATRWEGPPEPRKDIPRGAELVHLPTTEKAPLDWGNLMGEARFRFMRTVARLRGGVL